MFMHGGQEVGGAYDDAQEGASHRGQRLPARPTVGALFLLRSLPDRLGALLRRLPINIKGRVNGSSCVFPLCPSESVGAVAHVYC